MANRKISDLTVLTAPSGANSFPIIAQGATKQLTLDTLFNYVDSGYFRDNYGNSILDEQNNTYYQFKIVKGNLLSSGADIFRVRDGVFRVDKTGLFFGHLSGNDVYINTSRIDQSTIKNLSVTGNVSNINITGSTNISGSLLLNSGIHLRNSSLLNPILLGPLDGPRIFATGNNSKTLGIPGETYFGGNVTVEDMLIVRDNLYVTGNAINLYGNVVLGVDSNNTLSINASWTSNIVPNDDWLNEADTIWYDLGASNKRWRTVWAGRGRFHDAVGITGNLNVNGNTILGTGNQNELIVNSKSYFNDSNGINALQINVSGNTILGDAVSDTILINGTPFVNSPTGYLRSAILSGDLTIGNNLQISGGLNVNGILTATGLTLPNNLNAQNLYVSQNIYNSGNLHVSGFSRLTGALFVGSGTTPVFEVNANELDLNKPVHIKGDLGVSGFTRFSGTISITGGRITLSGVNLITSGEAAQQYATITNLRLTGSSLRTDVTSLINANYLTTSNAIALYATKDNLTLTGSNLSGYITGLANVYSTIVNLQSTGKDLTDKITSISGDLTTGYVKLTEYLNLSTGINTFLRIDNTNQRISGTKTFLDNVVIKNLTVTGAQVITADSFVNTNFITVNTGEILAEGITNISGGLIINRGTGMNAKDAYIIYNENAKRFEFGLDQELSGIAPIELSNQIINNLQSTGINLKNNIDNFSGFVTGNYLTSILAFNTYGTITDQNTLSTNIVTQTNRISSLSGLLTTSYRTLSSSDSTYANRTNTTNSLNQLSGNLFLTGSNLRTNITNLSGFLTGNYLSLTGTQTISGDKNFLVRPTLNSQPIFASGDSILLVQDESFNAGRVNTINFIGDGVTTTVAGSTATVNISITGLDEGVQDLYNRIVNLQTGVVSQQIAYGTTFTGIPSITVTIEDRNDPPTNTFFFYKITGASTNACFLYLSQIIPAPFSGYYAHLLIGE